MQLLRQYRNEKPRCAPADAPKSQARAAGQRGAGRILCAVRASSKITDVGRSRRAARIVLAPGPGERPLEPWHPPSRLCLHHREALVDRRAVRADPPAERVFRVSRRTGQLDRSADGAERSRLRGDDGLPEGLWLGRVRRAPGRGRRSLRARGARAPRQDRGGAEPPAEGPPELGALDLPPRQGGLLGHSRRGRGFPRLRQRHHAPPQAGPRRRRVPLHRGDHGRRRSRRPARDTGRDEPGHRGRRRGRRRSAPCAASASPTSTSISIAPPSATG